MTSVVLRNRSRFDGSTLSEPLIQKYQCLRHLNKQRRKRSDGLQQHTLTSTPPAYKQRDGPAKLYTEECCDWLRSVSKVSRKSPGSDILGADANTHFIKRNFINKGNDAGNLPSVLKSKSVIETLPTHFKEKMTNNLIQLHIY